jgi:hypothetical protein
LRRKLVAIGMAAEFHGWTEANLYSVFKERGWGSEPGQGPLSLILFNPGSLYHEGVSGAKRQRETETGSGNRNGNDKRKKEVNGFAMCMKTI